MAVFIAMPKLGINMIEGTIVSWLVAEGEEIQAGQVIMEIETDKATQEVEAPADGTLARVLKHEGETVPCNMVMAVVVEPGEDVPADIPEMVAEGVAPRAEVEVKIDKTDIAVSRAQGKTGDQPRRVSISPSARALAKELGVDITKIVPRGSRIKRADVEAAREAMKAEGGPAAEASKKPMTTVQRRIAEHMSRSARSVARVGLTLEADVTALIAWRKWLETRVTKVSYNVLLAKLVATVLGEFPYMNVQLADDDAILEMADINVGIAVDAKHGLLVPVLHEADSREVTELQEEYAALTERALQGKSTLQDLEGGTFTITNLGSLEIEQFMPIINVPECAILGIGAIVKKPVVIGDLIEIRPMMTLTLAFDHRLVDGAAAARFLQRLKHLVENPQYRGGPGEG